MWRRPVGVALSLFDEREHLAGADLESQNTFCGGFVDGAEDFGDIRRACVRQFNWSVVYRIEDDGSVVIAALSDRRDLGLVRWRALRPGGANLVAFHHCSASDLRCRYALSVLWGCRTGAS